MSVTGATHRLAASEAHAGRPDAASSLAQHRDELTQAAAERQTQRIKTADAAAPPRQRSSTARHVDKSA